MRPSRPVPARPLRPASALALAALAALSLAGCTSDPAPRHSASRSASPSSTPHRTATTTAAPNPSASATATAVSIPCSTLVSPQTVYDFNPIYSAKSPFTPASGTPAARVKADRGTVCEWVNTSSGATIDVAVGSYTPAALAAIKASSFTGGATTSGWGGDAGYFAASGGVGTATALVGSMWVTARGAEFLAAGDADPFMRSAVTAARSAG